ncbi:hypothetical protein CAPTEDRAFT_117296 [Capitella teleta]|uniref:G-protein coupled receptors family 1 profile domain-containing protein n=1 Tax=Capitella teleta TaxID=283909 RepID=R7V1S8_CAPTE|nr:hypothetical protein CAPTEDRAFT_117296 [Capitella teleta]|eukprot:ELU10276.1 hypothetical protein CAPTEDRAFT_117296 [Capitella teleta]
MYTLDQPTTVALLCLYLPVFALSLAGNSLVIYVVYKNPHMRRLKNLFLVNLAIADLAVTLICMPLTAGQIVFRLWVYGGAMCKLIGYIQGVAVNCSIFTLAALSIDRYLAIKNSVVGSCNSCMSPGLLFLATWLPAAICMSPLLCVRQVHAMAFPEFGIEISYCIEEWPKQMDRKGYGIALLFVTYILPLVIIIGCYSLIGRKLCSVEFHRKTSDSSSTVMLGRKRVARMLIALIAVFVLSWLPYNVTSLSLDLNYKYLDARVLPYTLLLAHAHSAVNPFLYWFLNKSFRHCMRRALRCSSRRATRGREAHKYV